MLYLLIFVIIVAIATLIYGVGYTGNTLMIYFNPQIKATDSILIVRSFISALYLTAALGLTVFAVALGQVVFK